MEKSTLKCFQFYTQDRRQVATSFVTANELKRYITDNLPPQLHAPMLSDANGDERIKTKIIKFLKDNESTYRISYLNGSGAAFQLLNDLGIAKPKELGIRTSEDTIRNWLMLIPTYAAMMFIKSYAPIFIEKLEVDITVTQWVEFDNIPNEAPKRGIINIDPDFIYQQIDLNKLKEKKPRKPRTKKEQGYSGRISWIDGRLNLSAHLASFLKAEYINVGIITGKIGQKGILVIAAGNAGNHHFALYQNKRPGGVATTFTLGVDTLNAILKMEIPTRGYFNATFNPDKNTIEIDFTKRFENLKGEI